MSFIDPGYFKKLERQLRKNTKHGIAAAIRIVTTENPDATLQQMITAGALAGLNKATVQTQFYKARREDAAMDRAQARAAQRARR